MAVGPAVRRLAAFAGDLVLGSVCAGCETQPGLLCEECAELLRSATPGIRELAFGTGALPVATVADYEGAVRDIILAHKERGRLGLARPLGDALAVAVVALIGDVEGPFAVVPVPSSRRAVRDRGHDPLARAARRAAVVLRRGGYDCRVVPALRHQRTVADQSGLGSAARRANLDRALAVRRPALPVLGDEPVVVVDDIVTTGATLCEAVRALREAGRDPLGAAVIAAA